MEGWVGFSDDELRRLKGQQGNSSNSHPNPNAQYASRGRPTNTRGRSSPKERFVQKRNDSSRAHTPTTGSALPPEARLSRPPPPETKPQKSPPPTQQTPSNNVQDQTKQQRQTSPPDARTLNDQKKESNDVQKTESKDTSDHNGVGSKSSMVLDEKDIIKNQMDNVEKFQFQQKLIEEQNKKKRQLLSTAIVERQKKAQQEATKLQRIQKQLGQLDQLLALDVSIIRNKIEEASREYLDAQRRYERAEKEYIESKMDLHQKTELKDSLTEHLHLIIHQNEVRKAKRLTELMQKLSMEDGEEVYVEGLDSEELAKTAPSAFILGSIHSSQEQRMMMRRSRGASEGENNLGRPESPIKRSASDQCGRPAEGVTGWISGLIFGKSPEKSEDGQPSEQTKGVRAVDTGQKVVVAAPVSSGSPINESLSSSNVVIKPTNDVVVKQLTLETPRDPATKAENVESPENVDTKCLEPSKGESIDSHPVEAKSVTIENHADKSDGGTSNSVVENAADKKSPSSSETAVAEPPNDEKHIQTEGQEKPTLSQTDSSNDKQTL